MKLWILLIAAMVFIAGCVNTQLQEQGEKEYKINDVTIQWLGHSSFRVENSKTTAYFDPFVLDSNPKKADYILVSHDHFDHCNPDQIAEIEQNKTRIISTLPCVQKFSGKTNSLTAGEGFGYELDNVSVSAFPAYNTDGRYHRKGDGVGLLLDIGGTKIYHAGDTDNIPEFSLLADKKIDVLLVPIGGKYTMGPEEAAEAAKTIRPRNVIPMHYNSARYGIPDVQSDPGELKKLLEGSEINVIILQPLSQWSVYSSGK